MSGVPSRRNEFTFKKQVFNEGSLAAQSRQSSEHVIIEEDKESDYSH
jgi:hypothetical protein